MAGLRSSVGSEAQVQRLACRTCIESHLKERTPVTVGATGEVRIYHHYQLSKNSPPPRIASDAFRSAAPKRSRQWLRPTKASAPLNVRNNRDYPSEIAKDFVDHVQIGPLKTTPPDWQPPPGSKF